MIVHDPFETNIQNKDKQSHLPCLHYNLMWDLPNPTCFPPELTLQGCRFSFEEGPLEKRWRCQREPNWKDWFLWFHQCTHIKKKETCITWCGQAGPMKMMRISALKASERHEGVQDIPFFHAFKLHASPQFWGKAIRPSSCAFCNLPKKMLLNGNFPCRSWGFFGWFVLIILIWWCCPNGFMTLHCLIRANKLPCEVWQRVSVNRTTFHHLKESLLIEPVLRNKQYSKHGHEILEFQPLN